MAFDLLCMQISTTCDNYNNKKLLFKQIYTEEGTQWDVTAVVSLLMFH